MTETEDFLEAVLTRQHEAGRAIHDGDAGPWSDLWSRSDPVTLFGAWVSKDGHEEVAAFNEWLASQVQELLVVGDRPRGRRGQR